ncbi:MAG: ABC transporter ATP-binding protein [Phototrophicaceae bacterium]
MQIRLDNTSVQFESPDGAILKAVGPVSFDVEAGSFVALLGPSGSGKSTLIRAIAGLQKLHNGTIRVNDDLITEPHESVGMMFQDATLMPWRSVHDNIGLPLEMTDLPKVERDTLVREVLPLLDLGDFGQAYPGELSGGMAQRVALGRALVQQPEVLLLDEPFGALDAMTREKISFDLLRVWAEYKQTMVMVTHDINEAVLLSDRIIVLSQRPGRVIADITVPLERPRNLEMIYTQPFIETAREVRQAIDSA